MSGISALSSLCSAYASDSEVEEEPSEINNNKHTKCSPNERDSRKSTNKPEVGMAVKSTTELRHEVKHETGSRSKRPRRRSRKNTSKANSKSMGIQKSTLLEKLLAPEVRHERNAILQCLRHIVKRNFFGAGDMSNLSENIVKNENCDQFVNKSL
ncbi:nuclear fragile X mental retardation protein interacting protein 1 [Desmophyllum pertusum]|uniref:Nuclear fragile X mental retardation protein interacting protein 1 n=1 Tax=Desmophyllum pertusum TaxID=174260 RepID=A0A9W9YCB7_9CNID|nr:nuclear fragile X mental retardation protein interacting protein 1 [Desmophyllum pertusum]